MPEHVDMSSLRTRQISVVSASTVSFTVCFAVWMMFAVIGIPIKNALGLNETQFGLLAAMPVLTGSLIRLPLGMLTDKYGGRVVFFVLMLSTVVPIWLISEATQFWQFLVLGLFVGLAGGLGGFLLPIMFGALVDLTGVNSTAFMLLWGITAVSLVWMYWTEIVPLRAGQRAAPLVGETA
jgi:nitrate/nitrite transporter NarK